MGACLYGGYRRKIYPLYSVAYITSSLSKEWERAFLWVSRKIFFYGINFDAAARFALWRWHQNWCHSTKTRFRLSFLVPKRSQAPVLSRVWRQNGANLSQNLLPHHYRNLRASKTTFIFETSWKYFVATYLPVRGVCVCLTSPFPYSNMEGKKTTSYFSLFENLSLLLYRTVLRQKVNTGQKLFLLLLYRNIKSKKVNTASELFSSTT